LSVATLDLPALCERPGDILPLAHHFINVYRNKLKLEPIRLSPATQAALLAYEWPGNIRELENVIHYALIVCRNNTIEADDLKLVGALHREAGAQRSLEPRTQVLPAAPSAQIEQRGAAARLIDLFGEMIAAGEPELFDSVEESLVRTAFARCGNNQVQTARALGISRNILRTHLKRFGLIGGEHVADQASALLEEAPVD
ncbi:MAG: AAA family ATPase, partial [Burkholderiaceae bacterium]|nr:AAA family ATPase [Burkholderiaceae bacterium]